MGKLKIALYFLPACGLGFVIVLATFFIGAMLSLFVAPSAGRSTDEVLREGMMIGLVLYLATLWGLQHRLIRNVPISIRIALFFVLPAALVILYGWAYYLETGIALAFIVAPSLCPLLVRLSERRKE